MLFKIIRKTITTLRRNHKTIAYLFISCSLAVVLTTTILFANKGGFTNFLTSIDSNIDKEIQGEIKNDEAAKVKKIKGEFEKTLKTVSEKIKIINLRLEKLQQRKKNGNFQPASSLTPLKTDRKEEIKQLKLQTSDLISIVLSQQIQQAAAINVDVSNDYEEVETDDEGNVETDYYIEKKKYSIERDVRRVWYHIGKDLFTATEKRSIESERYLHLQDACKTKQKYDMIVEMREQNEAAARREEEKLAKKNGGSSHGAHFDQADDETIAKDKAHKPPSTYGHSYWPRWIIDPDRSAGFCLVPNAGSELYERLYMAIDAEDPTYLDNRNQFDNYTYKYYDQPVIGDIYKRFLSNQTENGSYITKIHREKDLMKNMLNLNFLDNVIVKKVIVTRHPFARLYQAFIEFFNFKKQDNVDHFGETAKIIKKNFSFLNKEKEELTKGYPITFEAFLNYIASTKVEENNIHFRPSNIICSVCRLDYQYIVKQETIENDILKGYVMAYYHSFDQYKNPDIQFLGMLLERQNLEPEFFKKVYAERIDKEHNEMYPIYKNLFKKNTTLLRTYPF